jgi:hypothetical protein
VLTVPQTGVLALMESATFRMMMRMKGLPDPSHSSPFLTRRYAYKGDLGKNLVERGMDATAVPMSAYEEMITRLAWNAAHIRATKVWGPGDKAVQLADQVIEKAVGGRAIGERAVLFRTQMGRVFFPFQLEVNNFILYLQHDLKYDIIQQRERTKGEIARHAMEIMAYSWIYNWASQQLFGDNVVADPIDALVDSVAIANDDDDKDKNKGLMITGRLAGEVISAIPGGNSFAALIPETGPVLGTGLTRDDMIGSTPAGRYAGSIPIASAVQKAARGEGPADLAWNLSVSLLVPFGGRQIEKTRRGIEAVHAGEIRDYQDRKIADLDGDLTEQIRAILFGTNAHPAVERYKK